MKTDLRGVPVTGADSIALLSYETALGQFHSYTGDAIATIDEAIAASPSFIAAHLFKAFVLYTIAERKFVPMAAASLLGACTTDAGASFYIVQNQVTEEGCVISADPGACRARGTVDVLSLSGYIFTPVVQSLAWSAAIIAVFAPIAVRKYRATA